MKRCQLFKDCKYVPMLRGKSAEFDALRDLAPSIKDKITPLIEVPVKDLNYDDPETSKKLAGVFHKIAKNIEASWGHRRLFLDLGHLHPSIYGSDGRHPVVIMWEQAQGICLFPPTPVPVVSLGQSAEYLSAVLAVVSGSDEGVCLRLHQDDFLEPHFHQDIQAILNFLDLGPEYVDLIFDFGLVDLSGFDLMTLCAGLPHLERWRTLTTVGGAFPKDLTGMELGANYRARWEWRRYRDQSPMFSALPRIPSFGDYTIQHPIYIEPGKGFTPSASVRYSCGDDVLVMKGEKPRDDNAGPKQYVAHAQMLVEHDQFLGAHFSAGDAYIAEKAAAAEEIFAMEEGATSGTGNSCGWLYAGINHHITLATQQVGALFGS